MERKSKLLLWIFFFIICATVLILFFKIVVFRDYLLKVQVSCDPTQETCFSHMCDASFEECSGQIDQDISYYKFVEKSAVEMPNCKQGEDGCFEPGCSDNENGCVEIFCTDETVQMAPGDTCSDPAVYNLTQNEAAPEITE